MNKKIAKRKIRVRRRVAIGDSIIRRVQLARVTLALVTLNSRDTTLRIYRENTAVTHTLLPDFLHYITLLRLIASNAAWCLRTP